MSVEDQGLDWVAIGKEGRRYRHRRGVKERLYDLCISILWRLADSATMHVDNAENIFESVPNDLAKVSMVVETFSKIPHDELKYKELRKWLKDLSHEE